MKVRKVVANNRKRQFEVHSARGDLPFPYAKAEPEPTPDDKIVHLFIDPELANEGFTYTLESGEEGSVLMDWVLSYNEDPRYLAEMKALQLAAEARQRLEQTPLSRRELCRRLGTSPSQLYRIIDPERPRPPVAQLIALLYALDAEVSLSVKDRKPHSPSKNGRSKKR
ncbi:MAG: helix-turn-helix domain-containing protein [Planctomycetota bacterium]